MKLKEQRARNLALIRWMMGGHEQITIRMAHITNANYVSRMINGEKTITDEVARKIEKAFDLPGNWLDRENETLIKVNADKIAEILPEHQDSKIEARRSRNLDMIRWMAGGHTHAAKKVAHVINPTYLCKMAKGLMEIPDSVARSIEKEFELPLRWLDRDNEKLVKLSHEYYESLPGGELLGPGPIE
jgi:plasmid maintenance system antidote protein VapI